MELDAFLQLFFGLMATILTLLGCCVKRQTFKSTTQLSIVLSILTMYAQFAFVVARALDLVSLCISTMHRDRAIVPHI